jgi:hypothetical protein
MRMLAQQHRVLRAISRGALWCETMGTDAYETALGVVEAANRDGIPLKLIGGQAVRYLTAPTCAPRVRSDQDMDFASVSSVKKPVMDLLFGMGFQGDRQFNTMHGHRQMYFVAGGTSVDVVMDELRMCHALDFKDRIDRMPYTLDVTDLLLTKLQVVEQNEKDVQDIIYLLACYEVREGDEPGTIGLERFGKVMADDWGWWRTTTGNLDRVVELARGELKRFVPPACDFDPVGQAGALRRHADAVPKGLKWKVRARVGDRVQWNALPEEVGH